MSERVSEGVASWAELDAQHALHQADHKAIVATETVRSLVLDLFASRAARDLFNACARLGGLLAMAGASPSLAANTIDGAVRALSEAGKPFDPTRIPAARASVLEGYVAVTREVEHAAGLERWEYPACAVPLADGSVAIACGHPTDDPEALSEWAGRVVSQLVKKKVRRIVLAGSAKAEVASAAELVGIVVGGPGDEATESKRSGWLWLPWKK